VSAGKRTFEELHAASRFDPDLIEADAGRAGTIRFRGAEFFGQLIEQVPGVGPRQRSARVDGIQ
jgi:hypothetical protein